MEEQPTMVILYDMIIMLKSCLQMLQPKLDVVIRQGKSAVGHRIRSMKPEEELLIARRRTGHVQR